jgi:hypothetical protein
MKIILSRKGFDSTNGGCPSPIMPDGTLLSMPIPSEERNDVLYSEIAWNDKTYLEILQQLSPKRTYNRCHLDPDLRDNRIITPSGWKPAFGQMGSAQGVLSNAGVGVGDIFLFFGWFRRVEAKENGYRYAPRNAEDFFYGNDLQVVYGYMQVGEVITEQEIIKKYYWHPHSSNAHTEGINNTLYLPADKLSINSSLKGYGTLDYREDRVLTMKDKGRATWNEYSFLMPEHVYGNRKNSAKDGGLYYSGIWQELVVCESDEVIDWARSLIS